jgi:hypothetical protein
MKVYKCAPEGIVTIVDDNDKDLINWRKRTFKKKPKRKTRKCVKREKDVIKHPDFFDIFFEQWNKLCVDNPGRKRTPMGDDIRYDMLWNIICDHPDRPDNFSCVSQLRWYLDDAGLCVKRLPRNTVNRNDAIDKQNVFINHIANINGIILLPRNIKILRHRLSIFRFMDGFFKIGKYHVVVEFKTSSIYTNKEQLDDYVKLVKLAGYKNVKRLMVFDSVELDINDYPIEYEDNYYCDVIVAEDRLRSLI